ncbi:MAG: MtaA/CmuA family methyltransferase [Chloroflexota bacterium]
MNTKERFMNAIHCKPVDRPPVGAAVTAITVSMMEDAGIHYPEANHTVDQLADLAASVWEHAELENIKLPFGMTVEAEALGCEMDFGTYDTLPTEISSIFNHPDELAIPDDFFDRKRVPIVLKAITKLRKRYDNEVAIVSSIVGPFALGAKLFGFDNLFPWIITNPDYVYQVLDKLTDLSIMYANAQLDAGADVILLGEATCSGDLISADTYRDVILPHHQRMCAGIKGPTIMHVCGGSTLHVPHLLDSGTSGYSFDEGASIDMIRTRMGGKASIIGYVPTVEVLLNGTPDDVYQASLECMARGANVLAPGCSLPQHTSRENVAAMVKAARDWAQYPELHENTPHVIAEKSPAAKRAEETYAGLNGENGTNNSNQRSRRRRRSRG